MDAKITMPLDCNRVINYHEKKVNAGIAELLCAYNFLKEAYLLTTADKKDRFRHLRELNKNISRNTLQVVLGFPREERLAKEKLVEIAVEYMESIGFGQQPYLVYEHNDAGAQTQPAQLHGDFALKNVHTGKYVRIKDANGADGTPIVAYSPENWKCVTWQFMS